MQDEIYTLDRAAEQLGVKPATLSRHARSGRVKGHKAFGRWYFLHSDLIAAIRK